MFLAVVVTTEALLSHAALISAGWGYIASYLNEILKQDGFPKVVNTVLAGLVVILTAVVVAVVHEPAGVSLSWAQLTSTLWYAAVAAGINYYLFLKPTGLADWLQSKTSIIGGTFQLVRKLDPAPVPPTPASPGPPSAT